MLRTEKAPMYFLILDNQIIAHGTKREDLSDTFRETMYRLLSSSRSLYIDDEPVSNSLPRTFPERLDAVNYYMLSGTDTFIFKSAGNCESVVNIQSYNI